VKFEIIGQYQVYILVAPKPKTVMPASGIRFLPKHLPTQQANTDGGPQFSVPVSLTYLARIILAVVVK
jgi:hypothetical protein